MNDARDRDGPGGRAASTAGAGSRRADTPAGGRAAAREGARRTAPRGRLTLRTALRRRTPLFLAVLGAVLGAALLVLALSPRLYTATSEIVLPADDPAGAPAAGERSAPDLAARAMQRIGARGTARAVATALGLDRDPDFARRTGAGSELVRRLRHLAGAGIPPAAPLPPAEAMTRSIDRLVAGLAMAHVAETYSLTISYTAEDPRAAARIANAYARHSGARPAGQDDAAGSSPSAGAGRDAPGSPSAAPSAVRIISEAEPPLVPSAPHPLRTLALALALGLLLGAGAAYAAERMFAGLTGGAEVEERLGLLHLGSVPQLASVLPDATVPLDAVIEHPMSGFAEAFRGVLAMLRDTNARRAQVVAISSALPNEGKSTIAACLARTVALAGDRVVLVDCDARRRDTSAMFGGDGEARPGLAHVLRGEAMLEEALVHDVASGAWILPLTGPAIEMSALLAGPPMAALIEELRQRFARVLIDTAPVLALAETRVIATMVDLVVIVVRWRATADHAVRAAVRLLPRAQGQIAGIVLSRVDMRRQVRYAQGDASFYYRQYCKYYS